MLRVGGVVITDDVVGYGDVVVTDDVVGYGDVVGTICLYRL